MRRVMPVLRPKELEERGILSAAELMAVSARTAPKGRGLDYISTALLLGKDKEKLAEEMKRIGEERESYIFERDANCVKRSDAVLIVGVRGREPKGLNCGACGFPSCEEFERAKKERRDFSGPNCVFYMLDLGIAIGSAVKTASLLNVDNRVMYTVGVAAVRLGLLDADVIIGIPLSSTGKNIFFDRK
jgi:uncharacterized ferredoxin-like protein